MRNRLLAWAVLTAAGLTTGCSPAASSDPADQTVSVSSYGMPLSEVPVGPHRRALRRLEEVRQGSGDWKSAALAPYAVPLLRPDVQGVAYYEFSVVGADGNAQGYIIVATGEHDTPLPLAISAREAAAPETRWAAAQ